MTELAIIAGTLVDVRNIGTHKSVKLTVHVPEELATKVVQAFGWPTMADPIPVAVARLDPVTKIKTMSLTQQAAMCCQQPRFENFLIQNHPHIAHASTENMVRAICGVESRKEFDTDPHAGQRWKALHQAYEAWCG